MALLNEGLNLGEGKRPFAPRGSGSITVLSLLGQGNRLRFLRESQIVGETTWVKGFHQWLRSKLAAPLSLQG